MSATAEAQACDAKPEDAPLVKHDPFPFKVISTIFTQQLQNGLRHLDYHRYRQYCTRRLGRIRRSLHFKQGRSRFTAKPIPADFQDERFLLVPLNQAERAWSYAMELKSSHAADASQINPRSRLHSIRRFSKAVKWSELLLQLCTEHAERKAVMEAEAYHCFMKGQWLMERECWKDASANLQQMQKQFSTLARLANQADANVFKEKAEEATVLLRQCDYQLGKPTSQDSKPQSPQRGGETQTLVDSSEGWQSEAESKLTWRGVKIVIPEKKIRGGLMQGISLLEAECADPRDADFSLDNLNVSTVIERYGDVSTRFGEALTEIRKQAIESGANLSDPRWSSLEGYLRETSGCVNVERNLLLLLLMLKRVAANQEDFSRSRIKPEEGVRFCDLISTNIPSGDELAQLPSTSKSAIVGFEEINTNARRLCVALYLLASKKNNEAFVLLTFVHTKSTAEKQQKFKYAKDLLMPFARVGPLFLSLRDLVPSISAQYKCRTAALIAASAADLEDPLDKRSIRESGKQMPHLTAFPPHMEPIPCKPLLFDLALTSLPTPDVSHRIKKEKKGLIGRVTGWWGRK